jgi:hypothetical protein
MTKIGLKILRRIIETQNLQKGEDEEENKPCYEWEPEDWEMYKDAVTKR